jgi:hypothetical protein
MDQQHDFIVTHTFSLWVPHPKIGKDGSRREASNPRTARAAQPRLVLQRAKSLRL